MTQSTAQIAETCSSASQRVSESALSNDLLSTEQVAREVHREDFDDTSVSALISFFEVLDRWDQEGKRNAEIV
jgi:hypothetical protein